MHRTCMVIIALFFGSVAVSQTAGDVRQYVKTVDSLRRAHKLHVIEYPMMSHCGGGVKGYYLGDKLVYISSVYAADLGYSSRDVYLKDTIPYKIVYREYFAEWEKHAKKYGDSDTNVARHMTYSDTLYTMILSQPPVIYKSSRQKLVGKTMDDALMKQVLECVAVMRRELERERKK